MVLSPQIQHPFLLNPSMKIDEVKLIVLLGDTSIGFRRTNLRGPWPVCRIFITGLLLQQNYKHRNKKKLCFSFGSFGIYMLKMKEV